MKRFLILLVLAGDGDVDLRDYAEFQRAFGGGL